MVPARRLWGRGRGVLQGRELGVSNEGFIQTNGAPGEPVVLPHRTINHKLWDVIGEELFTACDCPTSTAGGFLKPLVRPTPPRLRGIYPIGPNSQS